MNTAPDTPPTDQVAARLAFVRSALLPVALALGGALVGLVHESLSMRIWTVVGDPDARIARLSEVRVWGGVNVTLGAALGLLIGLVLLRGPVRVPPGEWLRRCFLPTLLLPLPLAAVPGWAGAALAGGVSAFVFLLTSDRLVRLHREDGTVPSPARSAAVALAWMVPVLLVSCEYASGVTAYAEARQRSRVARIKYDLRRILSMAEVEADGAVGPAGWTNESLAAVLAGLEPETSGTVRMATRPTRGETLLYRAASEPWELPAERALGESSDGSLIEFVYDPTNGTFSQGLVGLYHRAE